MLSARMETGSHKLLELSLSTSSRSLSIPGTHAVCLARGSFLLGLFQCLLLGKMTCTRFLCSRGHWTSLQHMNNRTPSAARKLPSFKLTPLLLILGYKRL